MHAIALRVSWAASAEKTRNAVLVKIKRLCQNVIILINLSVLGLGPDRVAGTIDVYKHGQHISTSS